MKNYPRELFRRWAAWQHSKRVRRAEVERAEDYLNNLRGQGRDVTQQQSDTCREYAVDVLGDDRYTSWLEVFTAVQSEFREGWIPPNYYENIVIPKLKAHYAKIGWMKTLGSSIFADLIGPDAVFPDTAYFAGGHFLTTDMRVVPENQIGELLFDGMEAVVFKQDESYGGMGVHFISREDFDPLKIRRLGMGVFQTVVRQHPSLDVFNKGSVASLRVNTVVHPDGRVSMPNAMMRIPTGDDTHVKSATNIRVAIDDDGVFLPKAAAAGFHLVTEHPGTDKPYDGYVLPKFRDAVELCIELQKRLPYICSIGWDIAIDADERVRILESNTRHNGFLYAEGLVGPCFKGLGWENLWKE
jgi:hypothetical protein